MAGNIHQSRSRPLNGLIVGISVSGSDPSSLGSIGLTAADVNDIAVELCRRLVSLGAQIVLGHQWRPEGVMEAVAKFAQAYQSEARRPIIHNLLAYPDRAALSPEDRKRLKDVVAIYDDDGPLVEHTRSMSLLRMRERAADLTHARVCIGGRLSNPEGFVPGVIEEAALTVARGKPIYPSGLLGGASKAMATLLRGDVDAFVTASRALEPRGIEWLASGTFAEYSGGLSNLGLLGMATRAGLTKDELEELIDTQNLDTVLYLTTRGLVNRVRRII